MVRLLLGQCWLVLGLVTLSLAMYSSANVTIISNLSVPCSAKNVWVGQYFLQLLYQHLFGPPFDGVIILHHLEERKQVPPDASDKFGDAFACCSSGRPEFLQISAVGEFVPL